MSSLAKGLLHSKPTGMGCSFPKGSFSGANNSIIKVKNSHAQKHAAFINPAINTQMAVFHFFLRSVRKNKTNCIRMQNDDKKKAIVKIMSPNLNIVSSVATMQQKILTMGNTHQSSISLLIIFFIIMFFFINVDWKKLLYEYYG